MFDENGRWTPRIGELAARGLRVLTVAGLASSLLAASAYGASAASVPSHFTRPAPLHVQGGSLAGFSLRFEPNDGQFDPGVAYAAHGAGYSVALNAEGATLALGRARAQGKMIGAVLRMRLLEVNRNAPGLGVDRLRGTDSYFTGKTAATWHTGVPAYAEVRYHNVYPGIDMLYHGTQSSLEYSFSVAPGASPNAISLQFDGAARFSLDRQGNLVLRLANGSLTQQAPRAAQPGSHQAIPVAFRLLGSNRVSFSVGSYDSHRPLIIDPTFTYVSYLGGNYSEAGTGVATDNQGNIYVSGFSLPAGKAANTFPNVPPNATFAYHGGADAFVAKIVPAGAGAGDLAFFDYIGGVGNDGFPNTTGPLCTISAGVVPAVAPNPLLVGSNSNGTGGTDAATIKPDAGTTSVDALCPGPGVALATDSSNNLYITGYTDSPGSFPTVNPFQAADQDTATGSGAFGVSGDAFVTEISASGASILYSTFLGGNKEDFGTGIALANGEIFVSGMTFSTNFPETNATALNAAVPPSGQPQADAFVTELDPTKVGAAQNVFSSYLGGNDLDVANGVAVNAAGTLIALVGTTLSTNLTVTANAAQAAPGGDLDAWVAAIAPGAQGPSYLSYLGGSGPDVGNGVTFDSQGNIYVVGSTNSGHLKFTPFPTTPGAFSTTPGIRTSRSAFVTEVNPATGALAYSTYFPGDKATVLTDFNDVTGNAITLDSVGTIYITGGSNFELPVTPGSAGQFCPQPGAPHNTCTGSYVAEVIPDATLTPVTRQVPFSTYIPGPAAPGNNVPFIVSGSAGYAIRVDAHGVITVAGQVLAPGFNSTSVPIAASGTPFQTIFGGGASDAYVATFSPTPFCTTTGALSAIAAGLGRLGFAASTKAGFPIGYITFQHGASILIARRPVSIGCFRLTGLGTGIIVLKGRVSSAYGTAFAIGDTVNITISQALASDGKTVYVKSVVFTDSTTGATFTFTGPFGAGNSVQISTV